MIPVTADEYSTSSFEDELLENIRRTCDRMRNILSVEEAIDCSLHIESIVQQIQRYRQTNCLHKDFL